MYWHNLFDNVLGIEKNKNTKEVWCKIQTHVSIISSGQQNLMKTYHNDANTSGITKIGLEKFLDFF